MNKNNSIGVCVIIFCGYFIPHLKLPLEHMYDLNTDEEEEIDL